MATETQSTTDHDTIRQWAEERNGRPAAVTDTGDEDDPGILRIYFPEVGQEAGKNEPLDEITWEEFFEKFDDNNLQFLYQNETADGNTSRFFKFTRR